MQAIPVRECRRLDLNSADLGVPAARLMANAGRALARAVARHAGRGADVLLFCGRGGNGGDGFAAARELERLGRRAWVVLAEPAAALRSPAARAHFQALDPGRVSVWGGRPGRDWPKARVLVDCLLGTGVGAAPRSPYDALVRHLNARAARGAVVVSCDVPSGWGTGLAVRPRETVTFHAPKEGMARASCGAIRVASIGIPRRAAEVGFGDLALAYPRPGAGSHKGENGVVVLVAGSLPFTGAPWYAGMAAYRAGADLVHAVVPEAAAAAVRGYGQELVVHAFEPGDRLTPAAVPAVEALLGRATALAVGPGLGTDPSTQEAVGHLLAAAAERGLPAVVDADGLDAVSDALLRRHGARMVLTPHAREFLDLAGLEATDRNVAAWARRHAVTVLRKGPVDVVADATRHRRSRGGHPTMTVGGTGDVLTGAVAALLSKGVPPFDAACAASHLVKRAGETAASLLSYGATAADVLNAIPSVLLRLP